MSQRRRDSRAEGHDAGRDWLPVSSVATRATLWALVGLLIFPIAAPSFFLLAWGLLGTDTVGVLSNDATLAWFQEVLKSPDWRSSLTYSTVLALAVSSAGCALLTVYFFYVRRAPRFAEPLSYGTVVIPALVPAVVYGLALRLVGGRLGVPEQVLLGLGHLVFVLPVQYFVFETIQDGIAGEIIDASETLGATPLRTLLVVYVPSVLGAIRAAFVVGFFFSFDEIVVAAFVIESPLVTVPKRLWDSVNRSMNPDPAIVASLLLVVYGLLSGLSLIPFARWRRRA